MLPKPRLDPPHSTALLLLLAAAAHASLHDDVSSEVTSRVPQCARDCFQSFFDLNFSDVDCSGTSSSLECACQRTGAAGHTVGEGAVQCLIAAESVGLCSDKEANQNAVDSAYRMCAHEPDAVQPTNPTIAATLLLDKSRLVVPTPGLSIVTSHATNVPTTMASPVTVSASFSQPSSQPTETDVASSPSDAEGAKDEDEDSSTPSRFSTAEIAGIAAGIAAAFAIAIITICLARRRRKKYFPDMETGFFMSNKRLKALSKRFSVMGQNISSPLHGPPGAPPKQFPMGDHGPLDQRRRTFIFPTATQRTIPPVRTVPSGTAAAVAGVAVTAASAVPMGESRSSSPQNTQQRPVLSLSIPKNTSTSSPRQQKPAPKREDSTPQLVITAPTFEREEAAKAARSAKKAAKPTVRTVEEDDSPLTEFEEDDRDSPIQVWRPPSLDPQSATTLYVADKTGNWVLADERQKKRISRVELEGSSPITTIGGNIPAKKQPKAPEPPMAAGALRPPAEIKRQDGARREMPSMASSVYSSDIPVWNPSPAPPVPTHPMLPRPLATRQPAAPRPRYSPVLNPFLDENGVSPVRSMFGTTRAAPRSHASPRFGARPPRVGSPPGQPSPTLGAERHRGRRAPQHQTSQPRTPERSYSPVPPGAFRPSPAQLPTLLAKRVGPEKAASLSLRDSETSRGSGRGSGGQGRLPSTPTWNPLLTPERRGDDLYLSLR